MQAARDATLSSLEAQIASLAQQAAAAAAAQEATSQLEARVQQLLGQLEMADASDGERLVTAGVAPCR